MPPPMIGIPHRAGSLLDIMFFVFREKERNNDGRRIFGTYLRLLVFEERNAGRFTHRSEKNNLHSVWKFWKQTLIRIEVITRVQGIRTLEKNIISTSDFWRTTRWVILLLQSWLEPSNCHCITAWSRAHDTAGDLFSNLHGISTNNYILHEIAVFSFKELFVLPIVIIFDSVRSGGCL